MLKHTIFYCFSLTLKGYWIWGLLNSCLLLKQKTLKLNAFKPKQSTRVPKGKLNSTQRKVHTKREIALQSYDFAKAVTYKFDTYVNIKVTCANCKICMNELKTVSSSIRICTRATWIGKKTNVDGNDFCQEKCPHQSRWKGSLFSWGQEKERKDNVLLCDLKNAPVQRSMEMERVCPIRKPFLVTSPSFWSAKKPPASLPYLENVENNFLCRRRKSSV